jgi:TolB-like protein/DNA-binding SARP family transcriptional activator
MLRVKLLGGAVVEGENGPLSGAAGQRKSLAVLGLLVAAGDRGMSRDRILAYVWPEVELEKGSHRLTQVLYALRRELNADDLCLGSCELRLNHDRVSSDVWEFETARQAGDLELAVELYGGPFLEGFFLTDAPEFERWVENERAGFAQQVVEALETLAAKSAAAGDHHRAAWWWQRLADDDPLSSRVTIHLMSALAAAGDRAEALERARDYQGLLERELQAAPNPAVMALADQMRRAPSGGLLAPGATVPGASLIGVLPFSNLSPVPANDWFAEGLTEELRSGLAGIDGVKVVARISVHVLSEAGLDARAIGRRLELHALVEGSVRQSGARMRLSVRLIDPADGCHLWSATYERTVTDAFAVQDELTGLIVAGVRGKLRA